MHSCLNRLVMCVGLTCLQRCERVSVLLVCVCCVCARICIYVCHQDHQFAFIWEVSDDRARAQLRPHFSPTCGVFLLFMQCGREGAALIPEVQRVPWVGQQVHLPLRAVPSSRPLGMKVCVYRGVSVCVCVCARVCVFVRACACV